MYPLDQRSTFPNNILSSLFLKTMYDLLLGWDFYSSWNVVFLHCFEAWWIGVPLCSCGLCCLQVIFFPHSTL